MPQVKPVFQKKNEEERNIFGISEQLQKCFIFEKCTLQMAYILSIRVAKTKILKLE
jgi:hypothetical protein